MKNMNNDERLRPTIDKKIKNINVNMGQEVTMLLLGAGESGKTTISKQMKILHLDGFKDKDRLFYRAIVADNILHCFKELIKGVKVLDLEIAPELQDDASALLKLNELSDDIFEFLRGMLNQLQNIWNDHAIQEVYQKRTQFQIFDCCKFFLSKLPEILIENYLPSDVDIIRSRYKTTGITEITFDMLGVKHKLIDIGGQRSERRKWINIFDKVKTIIYVTSLSEYDMVLFEDRTVNRMKESLRLFYDVCRCFSNQPVILFLNKSDVFKELLAEGRSITSCFTEYNGSNDFDEASRYIGHYFKDSVSSIYLQDIFTHVTCATDTDDIEFVWDAVSNMVLHKTIGKLGFDM